MHKYKEFGREQFDANENCIEVKFTEETQTKSHLSLMFKFLVGALLKGLTMFSTVRAKRVSAQ